VGDQHNAEDSVLVITVVLVERSLIDTILQVVPVLILLAAEESAWAASLARLCDEFQRRLNIKFVGVCDMILTLALSLLDLVHNAQFLAEWAISFLK